MCFTLGLKNPLSKSIYENMNAFVEKWSKIIYFVSMRITFPCVSIPYAIWSYYQYYTTDLGPAAFHLPFPFWWHTFNGHFSSRLKVIMMFCFSFSRAPFDRRKPITYFICLLVEMPPIFYSTIQAACNVSIPAAVCCIMIAFANDVKEEINELDKLNKMNKSGAEIYRKLCNVIQFHTIIKQLSWILHQSRKWLTLSSNFKQNIFFSDSQMNLPLHINTFIRHIFSGHW